jgi:hypothetical protein
MFPRSLKPFLLIGSAKSGTTALFFDICQHPDVFMPTVKEPSDLCLESVLTAEGRERYFSLFRDAPDGAWVGDASTTYTMRDTYPGVPHRAEAVLGPSARILFIGRDPLERLKSLYRHHVLIGREKRPLRDVPLEGSFFKLMSKYDHQLEPWLNVFSRDQILILRYEDYVRAPEAVVRRVWQHLGLEQAQGTFGRLKNVSSERYDGRGLVGRLTRSPLYKRHLRQLIPEKWRHRLQPVVSRKYKGGFDAELPADREAALRQELIEACRNFYAQAERFE